MESLYQTESFLTACISLVHEHVRTHEKNSGDAVRQLGSIIQSIFCAQSGANIRLTVWKWSGESRYPGAFPPVFENFRRAFFLPPDWPPWVSEDESPENLFQINVDLLVAVIWPKCIVGKKIDFAVWTTHLISYWVSKLTAPKVLCFPSVFWSRYLMERSY